VWGTINNFRARRGYAATGAASVRGYWSVTTVYTHRLSRQLGMGHVQDFRGHIFLPRALNEFVYSVSVYVFI